MATQLRFDVTALDQASKAFARMGAAVAKFERKLEELDGKKVDVDVDLDTKKAEAEVGAFARDMRTKLAAAMKALPDLEINADSSDADREIARIRAEMKELADKKIGVDIDAATARAEMERLGAELRKLGAESANIQVQADTAAALAALKLADAEANKLDRKRVDIKVGVDESLSDTLIKVRQLGAALGAITVPVAIVAAAPQLAALGQAAVQAAGATGLLPAIITTVAAGFGALKIAASGFGDALGEMGDAKKFAEALKGLAPSAQTAARAIESLKPAFDKMQLNLQQRLFAGLGQTIQQLGATFLPVAAQSFGRIVDSSNRAAKSFADVFTSAQRIADVGTIGQNASIVFENLSKVVAPLTNVFVNLATVGSRVLAEMTAGAGNAAQSFADFVQRARDTQQLDQWIRNGVKALGDLGSIALNVAGALGGIFKAATSAGGDFLGTLKNLTSEVKNFLNSAQGQTALTSIFATIKQTVDSAIPGVKALATAIGDVANKIADSQFGQKIGTAFSQIAQVVGPIASTLGSLAVTVLGPLVQAFGALAPILGPVATGLLGVWAAMKLMTGISAIVTGVMGLVTALKTAGTAVASGGLMTGLKNLAIAMGPGGIFGAALGIAGIALGIWASAQANAAQKVAEHQAAVSDLAGTLDKYTGATTAATRAKVADQIATMKLKDGTTSFGDALRNAGISVDDFVEATTGNQAKLDQLNGTLHTNAKTLIQNSDAWKGLSDDAKAYPGALDLITDAALGNVQAQEKLAQITGKTGIELQAATAGAYGVIGPLGEIGSQLGAMSGKFAEAARQTKEAGLAARDFGQVLDAIKPGLVGLKDGAAPLDTMVKGFKDLAISAAAGAQKLGDAAAATGGVTAGAEAAAQSMQKSRDAFVEAATGALGSKEAAEALADSIGLIPEAARINFTTNATGVQAEFNILQQQIAKVPGAKTITVSTLSADAEKQLESFGIKVERLKNGQVVLNLEDATAMAKFQAFMTTVNTAKTAPQLDLNTATAEQKAAAIKTYIDGIVGMAKADADTAPGTAKANELKSHIDGITALMKANADITPGTAAGDQLQAHISALVGIMTADANNAPGTAKGDAMRAYIQGLLGIMTADANSAPGTAKGDALKAYIDRLRAAITADANTGGANSAIDYAARPRTATITVIVNQKEGVRYAGQQERLAGGGVIGYSGGGVVGGRVHAASGLVLGGYSPGRDTVPAMLSRGEAVLVPELVRRLGARRILAANREASAGRTATITGQIASMMDGTFGDRGRVSSAVSGAMGSARGAAQAATQIIVNLAFTSTMPASTPELRRQIAFVHEELRKYERGKR